MKINKIVLHNFNSFEGINEFDFSASNENQNIIIIGGRNGAGKTSLFTAMKIGLYGPLAFGYISNNSYYTSRIKEFINQNAFHTNKVEASIRISLSLMIERDIKDYSIFRGWKYSNQKLVEQYYVECEGKRLNADSEAYFQNYLLSIIPPDLFEFFFFDGEEVGNIFSTSSYNTYVRNAVYVLCGIDIFETIRKYTRGYAGRASTKDEENDLKEYERYKLDVEQAEISKMELENELLELENELQRVDIELIETETAFKKAGGITDKEKKKLEEELGKAERLKTESSVKIKTFMEGLMPFYIVNSFNEQVTNQLNYEEKLEAFNYVQRCININEIRKKMAGSMSESDISTIVDSIINSLKPENLSVDTKPIYGLSKEESNRVKAMITSVQTFDTEEMKNIVRQKQTASEKTVEINKTLRNSIKEEDAIVFKNREKSLLKRRDEIQRKLYEGRFSLEQLSAKLNKSIADRDKAWIRVRDNAQNSHVYELSSGISMMMESLLAKKTVEIRNRLENLIVDNLKKIYRKDNLITHIEIDEKFQFRLYQDASYTASELVNLINNLGKKGFSDLIGDKGKSNLFESYNTTSFENLQMELLNNPSVVIQIFNRIDLNRLSRGERQIFILALYWSIIELSEKEIPFIIDTPYARIDASHRKEISEKFFPNISKQVVILSTDEEINEEYYRLLKPRIACEYLLINDESQNKTSVENRYFFEAKI